VLRESRTSRSTSKFDKNFGFSICVPPNITHLKGEYCAEGGHPYLRQKILVPGIGI
jgi:hypothetical protein